MLLKEKIKLWRSRFYGRQEVFGYKNSFFSTKENKTITQYMPKFRDSKAETVAERYFPLDDNAVENHIKGIMELLIYVLQTDGSCYFAAMDFDYKNDEETGHSIYSFEDVLNAKKIIDAHGIPCAIARSTKKGHHLYMFFDGPIEAKYVTSYVKHVYEELGWMNRQRDLGIPLPETFPKTIALKNEVSTGYGIKPPMHYAGMTKDQNCWVDEKNRPIGGVGSSQDQWEFFKNIPQINIKGFKAFMEKAGIAIEDIRLSEQRGAVEQREFRRTLPYSPPKDGDLNLVIQGCPAMNRYWNGPASEMPHHARVAILSWAMQCKNGLEVLRERWKHSPQAEAQIQYGIETYQQPWTCRALQEHSVCVKGRDPQFISGNAKTAEGTDLSDFCFNKIPPKEVINGKLVVNSKNLPESDWNDPSPVRLKTPTKKSRIKTLLGEIEKLTAETDNLPELIVNIVDRALELKDEKARKDVVAALKKKKVVAAAELNAIVKEVKGNKILEKKKDLRTNDGTVTVNGSVYTVLDTGGYGVIDIDKEGSSYVSEISNFTIELEKDIRRHSLLQGDIKELHGKIICRGIETRFVMPTIEWNNNSRLAAAIADSAGTTAAFRMINLDKVREAAGELGGRNKKVEISYEDYGYDSITKPKVYRSANWNISRDGFMSAEDSYVDLKHTPYAKYLALANISNDDFAKVIHVVKTDLFSLQDTLLTYTAISHSLQAAIHNIYIPFRESPIMWIQGVTGSGKTTIARFVQCFHGDFPRLMNISTTMRSLEFSAMQFKDALLVIDDYKEDFNRLSTIKLIQAFYDRSGRGRLQRDFKQSQDTHCRGLILFTAEDRPSSEASALSRCIYVEAPQVIYDEQVATAKFRNLEKHQHLLSGVTGRFIHYMMHNYPDPIAIEKQFYEVVDTLKAEIVGKQNSNRIAQNLGANYLTWTLFCDFLHDSQAITREEHSEFIDEHWKNVCNLRDSIASVCGQEQASNVFLDGVREALLSGKYVIEGLPGSDDNKNATKIGSIEDMTSGKIYLYPSVALGAVKTLLRGKGSGLSHGQESIGKQLLQDGFLLDTAKGRTTVRKRINGNRHWVWVLDSTKSGIGPACRDTGSKESTIPRIGELDLTQM